MLLPDGGYCLWDFHQVCEHKVSTIWALNEFTADVGPTQVRT